jgi:hypothetical protein
LRSLRSLNPWLISFHAFGVRGLKTDNVRHFASYVFPAAEP